MSLFTGIGGLDLGLEQAGHRMLEMCESWEPARRVLRERFPEVPLAANVETYEPAARFDVLTAGFPCTDISHAGSKAGIFGPSSGLVEHVFRIAQTHAPEWIVLENVRHLLTLHAGAGISHVTERLENLGYNWAYRLVDTRFTGLPQRRTRVIILASKNENPATRLFAENAPPTPELTTDEASGFYWTEGRTGLGLVTGAVPTLKGGSMLGTPSAPAVWMPQAEIGERIVVPTIEAGERLQGFESGWTEPALKAGETNLRWKLVGNAVPVPLGKWVGTVIAGRPLPSSTTHGAPDEARRWPPAAWGSPQHPRHKVPASAWPAKHAPIGLVDIIAGDTKPLSHRATTGFLSRLDESGRTVPARFYADLETHQQATRPPMQATGAWASSPASKERMRKQRQKDTKPEVALRRELHQLGIRYRLQVRPVPELRARLDIVHTPSRTAVDVRGCFWHRCRLHGTAPKANAKRWAEKLDRNVERDDQTVAALRANGWEVVVVWEHDDMKARAQEIADLVKARRQDRPWMSPPTPTVQP